MTGPAANLPEEIRKRVEAKQREAIDAEIRALEEMIGPGVADRLAGWQSRIEELTESKKREAEEAAVIELAELQAFGEATLKRLDEELRKRREGRLADEAARRQARLLKEQQEEEKKRLAEEEAKRRKAAAEDPRNKVRTLIRHAQAHMARGDMEIAAKSIAEGLEIDGFNAELLDLDGKIREAMASDTFSSAAAPAADTKKAKDKARPPKPKKQKPKHEKPAPGPDAPAQRRFPAWAFTVIAAVLIAGAGLIAWLEYRPKPVEKGMTLAVLPWNASGDEGLGVFADGLPDVLVRALSAGPSSVGILGYSTTSGLTRLGPDPAASLARLGYSHFLRGTISRRDSLFAVRVELTDSTGGALWSADFMRDTAGLMLVPYEVTHGLRAYFREAGTAGAAVEVRNAGARLLYLEGLNALRAPGGSGTETAIGKFSEAVSADSTLSDAWAGLASALTARHETADTSAGDPIADAFTAATKAVSLSRRSAEGYLALARVYIEQRNFVAGLAALDTAAAIAPADGRVQQLRGMAFFRSGQVPQAIDILQKAYATDPRNPALLGLLATAHQVNRTFDRALWFRETAMHFSGDTLKYLAGPVSDLIVHDPELALNNAQRVSSACLRLLEGDPFEYVVLYSLARTLQMSGDIQESMTYFNGLESSLKARLKESPGDTRARMYLGLTLTRLGRWADAIALGEAAVRADSNNVGARYLLARIYALQMYSTQTKTVDPAKQARATELLKQALLRRFDDREICSADLYNVYNHGDIRSLMQ